MCSALILAFLLGSASAKGYNRSNTKLAIPKQDVGSPPADSAPRRHAAPSMAPCNYHAIWAGKLEIMQ